MTIYRTQYLEDALKDYVTKEMKDGIYVVVPDDVQQVDWHKTPQLMEKFIDAKTGYRYEWRRDGNNHFDTVSLLKDLFT